MAKFSPGDRVIANRTLVATVRVYDETLGRVVLEVDLGGGATDTIYGPIQSYDLELLVKPAETAQPSDDEQESEEETDEQDGNGDEFTTLDSLS